MTSIKPALFVIAAAALFSSTAMAPDFVTRFRLAQAPNNIQGCIAYDLALSRVHTFTLTGGQAEVKSAGGIDDKMKLVRPNVYETVFSLSGVRLDVVADLSSTPKTLTVTEKIAAANGWRWLNRRRSPLTTSLDERILPLGIDGLACGGCHRRGRAGRRRRRELGFLGAMPARRRCLRRPGCRSTRPTIHVGCQRRPRRQLSARRAHRRGPCHGL